MNTPPVADLQAMQRIYEVGNRCALSGEQDIEQCLTEIVGAAVAITGADKGNLQLLDAENAIKFTPAGGRVYMTTKQTDAQVEIVITLPLVGDAMPRPQAVISAASSTDDKLAGVLIGTRVLVVDDERDARALIRVMLERSGAEVRSANSATEGFNFINEWKPDVIVSDIGMPDVDGYQFMRTLRQWDKERGGLIPAVALTAYSRTEYRLQAMAAGYQMHLAKPIELEELVRAVASLTGRGSTGRQV